MLRLPYGKALACAFLSLLWMCLVVGPRLVEKVNKSIGQDERCKHMIGVLDIYGFESFDVNRSDTQTPLGTSLECILFALFSPGLFWCPATWKCPWPVCVIAVSGAGCVRRPHLLSLVAA